MARVAGEAETEGVGWLSLHIVESSVVICQIHTHTPRQMQTNASVDASRHTDTPLARNREKDGDMGEMRARTNDRR